MKKILLTLILMTISFTGLEAQRFRQNIHFQRPVYPQGIKNIMNTPIFGTQQNTTYLRDYSFFKSDFQKATQEGKPVKDREYYFLVTAPWCPSCQVMKEALRNKGRLVYLVDYDRYPVFRKSLMGNATQIPLLVRMKYTGKNVDGVPQVVITRFGLDYFLRVKL